MAERRAFALLGDPVAHSLSPALYESAFEYLGLAATYAVRRIPAERSELLLDGMTALAAMGGGNVTVPHKRTAARLVEVRRPAAGRTGAVNCFWSDAAGRLTGDNTDVAGFRFAVSDFGGLDLDGARVLLIGAGGAARAVVEGCAASGVEQVDILNRTRARSTALIEELGARTWVRPVTRELAGHTRYDLVVNATSLGLSPADPLPLRLDGLRVRHALDLVYGQGGTSWTAHAESLGICARDGLSMLVGQALESLERWFGTDVRVPGLAGTMLDAARSAGGR